MCLFIGCLNLKFMSNRKKHSKWAKTKSYCHWPSVPPAADDDDATANRNRNNIILAIVWNGMNYYNCQFDLNLFVVVESPGVATLAISRGISVRYSSILFVLFRLWCVRLQNNRLKAFSLGVLHTPFSTSPPEAKAHYDDTRINVSVYRIHINALHSPRRPEIVQKWIRKTYKTFLELGSESRLRWIEMCIWRVVDVVPPAIIPHMHTRHACTVHTFAAYKMEMLLWTRTGSEELSHTFVNITCVRIVPIWKARGDSRCGRNIRVELISFHFIFFMFSCWFRWTTANRINFFFVSPIMWNNG